jgi:hypothetical protein
MSTGGCSSVVSWRSKEPQQDRSVPVLWLNVYLAPQCASWLHNARENVERQQRLMAETNQLLKISRELIRRTREIIRSKQHEERPRD